MNQDEIETIVKGEMDYLEYFLNGLKAFNKPLDILLDTKQTDYAEKASNLGL